MEMSLGETDATVASLFDKSVDPESAARLWS